MRSFSDRKPKPEPVKIPLAWKCTLDGKYWAQSPEKKCRYCLPIYDEKELLSGAGAVSVEAEVSDLLKRLDEYWSLRDDPATLQPHCETLLEEAHTRLEKLEAFWEWSRGVEKRDFEYEWEKGRCDAL